MAQIWKEKLNTDIHRDYMRGHQDAGGLPIQPPKDNLIQVWIYFVKAGRYELQFTSEEDLDVAIAYFSHKIHSTSRLPNNKLEHYWQRWFERLPSGIHRDPSRTRILNTLYRLKQSMGEGTVPERLH